MPQTLISVLNRRETPSVQDVIEAEDEAFIKVPGSFTCLNPECQQICSWKPGRGRPQVFCSRRCKKRYDAVQARLMQEVERIEAVLERSPASTTAEQKAIRSMLAQRRYALRHYGIDYQEFQGEANQGTA
ncbi:hypothetical protein EDD41_2379 [Luteococcus japonicus]|uniref:Uncharacterized protein n=1 Tax=Luteococcus japonicus TaxID=33984 RepID=A0A3N1ZWC3_9ACTN|nr:hypothetical protein [Luteococcus japonicus]ROR55125.1 hypothetical protein EDD41_2379 [Luteococcus japonicus]